MKMPIEYIKATKTRLNETPNDALNNLKARHIDKTTARPYGAQALPLMQAQALPLMQAKSMRWALTPFAALFTLGLFVLMMVLISEEFKPQDKIETGHFDINPKVEDVAPPEDKITIEPYKLVTAPPPPPMIERAVADAPREAIVEQIGEVPDFEPPEINMASIEITVSDSDAKPFLRIPPIMPPRATRSGHCRVIFDVNPQGQPFNVSATYCTEKLFEGATIKSVQKWKYNPKILKGRAVSRAGVENKVTYKLTDGRGQVIPE